MIRQIVSGGQTGVDRGALDAALECGVPCGGWCPKGRRAEDGFISDRYPLKETDSTDYRQRTEWNVRDSDGTLILHRGPLEGGTALTGDLAALHDRPCLSVELGKEEKTEHVRKWLEVHHIRILNVAGPRESKNPGITRLAAVYVTRLLEG